MKVCVIHNALNNVGGGERVCLAVIEALKSMGLEVTLITIEPTDWRLVQKIMRNIIRPDVEISVLPFRIRTFAIYLRLLSFLRLVAKKKLCDLIINTHGDVLPISADIIYMHYPTFAIVRKSPVNIKYSKNTFWRLYFWPYERALNWLGRRMKWKVLLTNSEFSRRAIKRYLGVDAIVIHPPVEINGFLKATNNMERENTVVLCGRYHPSKNYEFALQVASKLPNVKFVIIGTSEGKVSDAYFSKLYRMKKRLRLKNVRLLRNVPRDYQIEIYSRARIFMHTMRGEHFGIAVVEGMAAGLVPLVHKSGGAWLDIVDQGKYGLGYENVDEAIEAIEYGIKNYSWLREKAIKRARMFSKNIFLKKFMRIVEMVLAR